MWAWVWTESESGARWVTTEIDDLCVIGIRVRTRRGAGPCNIIATVDEEAMCLAHDRLAMECVDGLVAALRLLADHHEDVMRHEGKTDAECESVKRARALLGGR